MWLPWRRHLILFYISQWPLLAIPTRRRIQISCKIRRKWLFTCSSFKCSFHGNGISVKVVLLLKMFFSIVSLCAKFQVGNKCTIQPKFRAMPPDNSYNIRQSLAISTFLSLLDNSLIFSTFPSSSRLSTFLYILEHSKNAIVIFSTFVCVLIYS